jgi:hypothetical protein
VIFASHTAFDLQESNFLFHETGNANSNSGSNNNRRQKTKNSKSFALQIEITLGVFVILLLICCLLPAYRRNVQNNEMEKKDEKMFVFREEADDEVVSERVTQIQPADCWQAENDEMDADDEKIEDEAHRRSSSPLQSPADSSSFSLSQSCSSSNRSNRRIYLTRKNSQDVKNTVCHKTSVISSSLSSSRAAESVTETKPPGEAQFQANPVELRAVSDSSSSSSFKVSAATEELEPEIWFEDISGDDEGECIIRRKLSQTDEADQYTAKEKENLKTESDKELNRKLSSDSGSFLLCSSDSDNDEFSITLNSNRNEEDREVTENDWNLFHRCEVSFSQ